MKSTIFTSTLLLTLSATAVLAQSDKCDNTDVCKPATDLNEQCKGGALDTVRAATNNSMNVDWLSANATLLAPFGACYCESLKASEGDCNECVRKWANTPGISAEEVTEVFELIESLTSDCKRGATDVVTEKAIFMFRKEMATFDANNVTDSKDLASRKTPLVPITFPAAPAAPVAPTTASVAAPTAAITSLSRPSAASPTTAAKTQTGTPTPTSAAFRLTDTSRWAVGVSAVVAGMLFG